MPAAVLADRRLCRRRYIVTNIASERRLFSATFGKLKLWLFRLPPWRGFVESRLPVLLRLDEHSASHAESSLRTRVLSSVSTLFLFTGSHCGAWRPPDVGRTQGTKPDLPECVQKCSVDGKSTHSKGHFSAPRSNCGACVDGGLWEACPEKTQSSLLPRWRPVMEEPGASLLFAGNQ